MKYYYFYFLKHYILYAIFLKIDILLKIKKYKELIVLFFYYNVHEIFNLLLFFFYFFFLKNYIYIYFLSLNFNTPNTIIIITDSGESNKSFRFSFIHLFKEDAFVSNITNFNMHKVCSCGVSPETREFTRY